MDSINIELLGISEFLDGQSIRHDLRSEHVTAYNPIGLRVILRTMDDALRFADRWYK